MMYMYTIRKYFPFQLQRKHCKRNVIFNYVYLGQLVVYRCNGLQTVKENVTQKPYELTNSLGQLCGNVLNWGLNTK
jgi:hypothetical protein